MANRPKPLLLQILDGFGIREERDYHAIALSKTPCRDSLQQDYPMTTLDCSGHVVGLQRGQMDNSEVGHLHIGSGRLLRQELSGVSYEVEEGSFFNNPVCGKPADLAPTILAFLGSQQPVELTGRSLI